MRPPALVIAATLAAFAVAQGCGVDESTQGPPFHPGNIEQPHSLLVTESDVEGIGPSSPYGVILAWWRGLQQQDVDAVKQSYAGHVSTRTARRQIRGFQGPPSQPIEPTEDEGRRHATVDVTVRAAARLGDTPQVIGVHDFPATFELVRKGGSWRLRGNAYGHYRRALLDALDEEQ